jgi:hypothetical protein
MPWPRSAILRQTCGIQSLMRDVGRRVSHVASLVQASSPDLAPRHVDSEQCGALVWRKFVINVPQPSGESDCRRPARIAPVPHSKAGLDQVHGWQGRGLPVLSPKLICAVSHLRHLVQRRAVQAKSAHPCAAPDCFACSEPKDRAGASSKLREGRELCTARQAIERSEKKLPSPVRRPTNHCSDPVWINCSAAGE